jgi:hypothetical protein
MGRVGMDLESHLMSIEYLGYTIHRYRRYSHMMLDYRRRWIWLRLVTRSCIGTEDLMTSFYLLHYLFSLSLTIVTFSLTVHDDLTIHTRNPKLRSSLADLDGWISDDPG